MFLTVQIKITGSFNVMFFLDNVPHANDLMQKGKKGQKR